MELETIKEVIAEVLNVDTEEITLDTTFVDDLGADSLDLFQIVLGIEERFSLDEEDMDTEAIEKIVTVGDAVELVKKAINQ
ncbi:MAG: acyl carrier protein [Lachnospiraceae bacterium]|nr:acyl carrier protein [Lachnospiraceae bacterium]